MKKSTHLKEIAYELGFSVNTISRALRDCYDISDKTKELVRNKAIEMGYLPKSVSQFIKRDNKKLVALIINDLKNIYFLNMCHLFAEELDKNRCDFTLLYTPNEKIQPDIIKQSLSQRVDSIVCFCEPTQETIKLAKLNNIPIVFLGEYKGSEPLSNIHVNNYRGGLLAANYVYYIHKAEKLIYVGLPNFVDSISRFESFKKTIHSLSKNADILFIDGTKDENYNILNHISDGYLNIFCFNDQLAYKLLNTLNTLVPNIRKVFPKLHIVGFDALSTKFDGLIDITSIDFDVNLIVKETIKVITNYWNGDLDVKNITIPVLLHTRKIL